MSDSFESLKGLIDQMKKLVREAVQETNPSSAISLTALRSAKPELARTIFVEAVIVPAKQTLKGMMSAETLALFDEIESRFRQEVLVNLYYEVETIVASRMIAHLYEKLGPAYEKIVGMPIKNKEGRFHTDPTQLLSWIEHRVIDALARLAALRERRVQLLLTTTIVGPDAVKKAAEEFGGYRRQILYEQVYQWLLVQNIGDEKVARRITDKVTEVSDEVLEWILEQLEGHAFMGEEEVSRIFYEIFEGKEDIEF